MFGRLDRALLRTLRTRGHWRPAERAIAGFSRAGEHSRLWLSLSLAGLILHEGKRPVYARGLVTVCAVEVANVSAKLLFRRQRPILHGLPPLAATRSQRSFPSAHAATSFGAARVLAEALPPAQVYVVAGLMALSRPYLGVHYPSDVVAGIVLGVAVAELSGAALAGFAPDDRAATARH